MYSVQSSHHYLHRTPYTDLSDMLWPPYTKLSDKLWPPYTNFSDNRHEDFEVKVKNEGENEVFQTFHHVHRDPAQGSPSGNPQVSPTKPSSVICSTLARIVRGPGSVPGWGLGNVVTAVGIFESPPPRGVLNSLQFYC